MIIGAIFIGFIVLILAVFIYYGFIYDIKIKAEDRLNEHEECKKELEFEEHQNYILMSEYRWEMFRAVFYDKSKGRFRERTLVAMDSMDAYKTIQRRYGPTPAKIEKWGSIGDSKEKRDG